MHFADLGHVSFMPQAAVLTGAWHLLSPWVIELKKAITLSHWIRVFSSQPVSQSDSQDVITHKGGAMTMAFLLAKAMVRYNYTTNFNSGI